MLTTEFIDGIKISDNEALTRAGISVTQVSNQLVKAFAEQIFHTGFIHADPHPGNRKDIDTLLFITQFRFR